MQYLGRYQLGEHVPLTFRCRTAARAPAWPDEAPKVEVYGAAGKALAGFRLPALERNQTTGLFSHPLPLDARFAAGHYTAVVRFPVGGSQQALLLRFQVVAGGDADGAVVALASFPVPGANYLVMQLDSGKLVRGRNPY